MAENSTPLSELERILDRFKTETKRIETTLDSLTTNSGAAGAEAGKEILAKMADAIGRDTDVGKAIQTLGGSVINAKSHLVDQLNKAQEEMANCIAEIQREMTQVADELTSISGSINKIIDFS